MQSTMNEKFQKNIALSDSEKELFQALKTIAKHVAMIQIFEKKQPLLPVEQAEYAARIKVLNEDFNYNYAPARQFDTHVDSQIIQRYLKFGRFYFHKSIGISNAFHVWKHEEMVEKLQKNIELTPYEYATIMLIEQHLQIVDENLDRLIKIYEPWKE